MSNVVDITGRITRLPEIVAIIPYKGKLAMTQDLVDQLAEDKIPTLALNNGAVEETVSGAISILAPGWNIHQMWNRGLKWAAKTHPHAHVAILNNDIRLSEGCLPTIAKFLSSRWDILLCSPNYDGRHLKDREFQHVQGICANRYDGTGGIAGFAMVLNNKLASGWRFDTDMQWWFGDADLTYHVGRMTQGQGLAVHLTTWVEHLDGGGQTAGDWMDEKWIHLLQADQEIFESKWGKQE